MTDQPRDYFPSAGGEPATSPASERPPFRPLGRRASWTVWLLVLWIVASVVALGFAGIESSLLNDLKNGKPVSQDDLGASDRNTFITSFVQIAAYVLTAFAFLTWFYRAYGNIEALGVQGSRFSRKWAVGAWFVPILGLWRPLQIANEIWRTGDPNAIRDGTWHRGPVAKVIGIWWVGYVLEAILDRRAALRYRAAETVTEMQAANLAYSQAIVVGIVAAVLAIVVVRRMTARQELAATILQADSQEVSIPLYRRRSAWASAATVTASLALLAFVYSVLYSGTVDSASAVGGGSGSNTGSPLVLRDSFDDPSSNALTVGTDEGAEFKFVDSTYSIFVKQAGVERHSYMNLSDPVGGLGIETTAGVHKGGSGDGYGVSCTTSGEDGFYASIFNDRYYRIAQDPPGPDADYEVLTDGTASSSEISDTGANTIRLECRGAGTDEATITLFVNGQELATVATAAPDSFSGFGLFTAAIGGNTEVRFEDLLVQEIPASER